MVSLSLLILLKYVRGGETFFHPVRLHLLRNGACRSEGTGNGLFLPDFQFSRRWKRTYCMQGRKVTAVKGCVTGSQAKEAGFNQADGQEKEAETTRQSL